MIFAPWRTVDNIWRHLWWSPLEWGVLLAKYTADHPTTHRTASSRKNYPVQNINCSKVEKLWLRQINSLVRSLHSSFFLKFSTFKHCQFARTQLIHFKLTPIKLNSNLSPYPKWNEIVLFCTLSPGWPTDTTSCGVGSASPSRLNFLSSCINRRWAPHQELGIALVVPFPLSHIQSIMKSWL